MKIQNNLTLPSRSSFNETNDCTVQAIARAMGIDYAIAHKLCADKGRKPRGGIHPYVALGLPWIHVVKKDKKTIKTVLGNSTARTVMGRLVRIQRRVRDITLKSFLKKYPTGRYICVKSEHAFAVIDGKVYGQMLDCSRIIYFISVKIKTK